MLNNILIIVTLLLAGLVSATPVPTHPRASRPEPLGVMAVYRRQIPAEVATKSPTGTIQRYDKRQIPAEVATKSPNGNIQRYDKRQIPAEVATKSLNGRIEVY